jgi:tetratricopeptide (TPR) repeat protein
VIYGVLGIGVIGLGVAIASHLSAKAELAASSEFGAALRVLDREVNANASTPPKAGEEPPFKSEDEKDAALITKLTEFRKANAGQRAAANAALPLAEALLRTGKAEEVLPLVEEFLKVAEPTDPLRPAAYEARGYALESQKKYDEAIAAFEQLSAENKTDFMKGMGLYHRARVLALKGDTTAAAKQYSEIEGAAPGSAAARLAKDRIAALIAQGVAVPTAPTSAAVDAGK